MIATDKCMSAPIVARTDHAPTLWSIRIKTPDPLPFRAGQYVAFGLLNGEKGLERAFPIASRRYAEELGFFIERVPHGALSPHVRALQPGIIVLTLRRP